MLIFSLTFPDCKLMTSAATRDDCQPSYNFCIWLIITCSCILSCKGKNNNNLQTVIYKQVHDWTLSIDIINAYSVTYYIVYNGQSFAGGVPSTLDASKFICLKLTLDFFALYSRYFHSFWIWFSLFCWTKQFHCSKTERIQWWIRPFIWLQWLTIRPSANYLLKAWQQALCFIVSTWSIMLWV